MEILIIFCLILLNGIFSMSEIALVSSRKFKLETLAKKGSRNAAKALELANNPNTFLSAVQIGITLIGILTGIFSGEKITVDLREAIEKVEEIRPYAQTIAVTTIVIIVTFFSIVFGELIPKRLGLMFPEAIASLVAQPMKVISIITKPFIWLLTRTNDLFLGILGLRNRREPTHSEEEIKAIVEESAESGEIQEIEQDIVHRVFALGDRKVRELMTRRKDLVYFSAEDDLDTVKQKAQVELHTVYPVIKDTPDNFIGIVSVKDLFPKNIKAPGFDLTHHLKHPLIVPESMPAYKVLEAFRKNRTHCAFVLDEYGMVQGLITMDDIVDALIGDAVEDEQIEYQLIQRDEDTWLADGVLPFLGFQSYFGLQQIDSGDRGYNTLAGLLLHLLHRIPKTGEKIKWGRFEFEIMDMDGPKIDKILIKKVSA